MSSGGFTLADRLGAKSVPCRVKGCGRTWIELSNKALTLRKAGGTETNPATEGMCEPCRDKFVTLADAPRPCDMPDCTGTWTWPVAAQLEAFAAKRQAPKALCAGCEEKLGALSDKEVACAVPGCSRQAILTKRAQLLGETGQAAGAQAGAAAGESDKVTLPGLFCAPCEEVSRKLRNMNAPCGIAACKRTWIWKANDQIQAFAAGKPKEAPRRMCDECRAEFGKLLDRQVRCRTSGCKHTWTWGRGDQLDACVAGKPAPKAPSHMCQTCFDRFSKLQDVERPCRRSGCRRTWTDKRGGQLARLARGKTGDPYPRYCTECEKELGDLGDRDLACKTDGCTGTWTWTKEQQLAAGVRLLRPIEDEKDKDGAEPAVAAQAPEEKGEPGKGKKGRDRRHRQPHPPAKLCANCIEFLTGKKTLEIPCSQCGTPIYWPPESQLQTHLGNWAVPGMCGACKRDATEAARQIAREALRHPVAAAVVATEIATASTSNEPVQ